MVTIFFFQAEDGIRDIGVTGVQTCALPIFQPLAVGGRDQLAQVLRVDEQEAAVVRLAGVRLVDGGVVEDAEDRKSVAEGKRVAHGGRRISKTKKIDKKSEEIQASEKDD